MLTLGIHCAGSACEVAILRNGALIAARSEAMRRGHDQRLPMLTQEAVAEAGLELRDIDRFAVCVGPGSFTGIRVGVAFARGLALANGSKAVGVTSLEAMLADDVTPAVAILPAKQRLPDLSFWVQSFENGTHQEPSEVSTDELKALFTGKMTGIAPPTLLEEAELLVPDAERWIGGLSTAEGVAKFASRETSLKARTASPLYVREPDAVPAKTGVLSPD